MISEDTKTPTVYENWTDFVVAIDERNWVKVLETLYSAIDSSMLPHFRFSSCRDGYGLALRLLTREDSETVEHLQQLARGLKIRSSVNPKKRKDDPLRERSGWYDDPESFNMTEQWANLLHRLSDSAMLTLRSGFTNSEWRAQVAHQFCNMMAIVERGSYCSRFKLKLE